MTLKPFAAVIFLLLAILPAYAQGPARTISVDADRGLITVGEQVQIQATTRDANGSARADNSFTWTSSNPGVVSIDGSTGMASGLRPGIAVITGALGGLRSTLSIEVLPLRVEVRTPYTEIFVGQKIQLTAVAFDISGQPIPNVSFQWQLSGANGGTTRAAGISDTGILSAVANALVTAKASLVYTNIQGNQVQSVSGVTHILLKSKIDFRVNRLYTSGPWQNSYKVYPPYDSRMGGNDLGQLAFVAPLDGVTNALVLYDNGHLNVLAAAGAPCPQSGSYVWSFQNPAVNNKGEVLARVICNGVWPRGGLMLATLDSANYVFLEGQSQGNMLQLVNFSTTRYSINDNDAILFRADFRYQGTQAQRTGLFKLSGGSLQLIQATDAPLPGLSSNYSFGFFGLDQTGNVYFMAFDASNNVLFKADGLTDPVRIAGTRDAFAGSVVYSIGSGAGFGISTDGTIGYRLGLANGTSGVARLRPSDKQPAMKVMRYGAGDVFSAAPNGDVLVVGGTDDGWGLHRWDGDRIVPVLVNSAKPDGADIWSFQESFATRTGDVLAWLMTSKNDFVVYNAAASTVAFQAGAVINTTANVNFVNPVSGSRGNAPLQILTGGKDVSIYEVNTSGAAAVYLTGQRVISGRSSWTLSNAVRNAAGDLYFTNSAGVFRYTAGRVETLLRTEQDILSVNPFTGYKVHWFQGGYDGSNALAVNPNGSVVLLGQADNGIVVGSISRGRQTSLAVLGGPSPTPSPNGGTFQNYTWGSALAIDETDRIMLGAQTSNGSSGLFVYDGKQWTTAAVLNSTQIDGLTIASIGSIKAANQKFYAQFGTAGNGWLLAEYSNGTWTSLVRRGDIMPNGGDITYIRNRFDVNRNGDLVFCVNIEGTIGIILRAADGTNHMLYSTSDPANTDVPLANFDNMSFDLRDDRHVYFTAIDVLDRNVLLGAEPLF
jgi:hypothetical protein